MKEHKKAVTFGLPGAIGMGFALSTAWTLLCVLITAIMMQKETVREENLGYFAVGILVAGGAIAAGVAGKCLGSRYLLAGLGAVGTYYAGLLGLNAVFFDGSYNGLGATALAVLGGALASVLLMTGRGGMSNGRKRRIRR